MSSAKVVWRLCRPEYAPGLNGEGARLQGGRWNSPGRPAVYTAASLALAALEVMVHLPASMRQPDKMPKLQAVALEIPAAILLDRPAEVARSTDPAAHRALGDDWLLRKASVGLVVPSRVIPLEENVVLNPLHPDFSAVRVIWSEPFVFDPRFSEEFESRE